MKQISAILTILCLTIFSVFSPISRGDCADNLDGTGQLSTQPQVTESLGSREGTSIVRYGQISEELFRGSRPNSAEDFEFLKSRGIKTIVSLEQMFWHTRPERKKAESYGIQFYDVDVRGSPVQPSEESIQKILGILTDPNTARPVYIHCALGRDRTSLLVAIYRIVFEKWNRDMAWNEMKAYGFSEAPTLMGLKHYFDEHFPKNTENP